MGELRLESGDLGVPGWVFCSPRRHPVYVDFAYLVFPRWALGVNVRPRRMDSFTPRNAAERKNRGTTTRNRQFRDSCMGLALAFRRHPHLRRFRVFSVSALRICR